MYSLIAYFIAFKVIDIVIAGLDESKSVWIISDHSEIIGETILARLGRGVTYLKGKVPILVTRKSHFLCD